MTKIVKDDFVQGNYNRPPDLITDFLRQEDTTHENNCLLRTVDFEFSTHCNLQCIYCFSGSGLLKEEDRKIVPVNQMFDLIEQAAELGVKNITLLAGGEPLLYKEFFELVKKANSKGITVGTFTNGTMLDKEMAKKLRDHQVTVIVKINSLNSKTHDGLVGRKGTFDKTMAGIRHLLDLGYDDTHFPQIGMESVIVSRNLQDIPSMWRFCRKNKILPFFERVGCYANTKIERYKKLAVEPHQLKELFETLLEIDQKEFNYTWPLLPLMPSLQCTVHHDGCYIKVDGSVWPCAGVEKSCGNVFETSLVEIVKSGVLKQQRGEQKGDSFTFKGACGTCEYHKNHDCYGCRGDTYKVTGDFLNEDPFCFHLAPEKK